MLFYCATIMQLKKKLQHRKSLYIRQGQKKSPEKVQSISIIQIVKRGRYSPQGPLYQHHPLPLSLAMGSQQMFYPLYS